MYQVFVEANVSWLGVGQMQLVAIAKQIADNHLKGTVRYCNLLQICTRQQEFGALL